MVLHWLSEQIGKRANQRSLLCADENVLALINAAGNWSHKPSLISNRWDIAELARTQGFESRFSDFDFSHIAKNSLQAIFYRVSKEKPVVHHIINEALHRLAPGGQLYLCGHKNEGIKTYIDKATQVFGCEKNSQKMGTGYRALLTKGERDYTHAELLDTASYPELRSITTQNNRLFYSKPGLFGWNKIDQGSEFLIEQLDSALQGRPAPTSMLDLGCGYGYLTMMVSDLPLSRRVMTDNNAAAIIAAEYNCLHNQLAAQVIPSDCGLGITGQFDLILCNPPFHQGFSVDGDLTDRFLAASSRLLAERGLSLWVVNQFIPLERKAADHFHYREKIAENRSFKVIALGHKP